jgi:hypothetical protein
MNEDSYYIDIIKKIKQNRKKRLITYADVKEWLKIDIFKKFSNRTDILHGMRDIMQYEKSNRQKLEEIKRALNLDYELIKEWYNQGSSSFDYYDEYIL